MPRRSGRYKWGSGKDPYHHGDDGGKMKHQPTKEQLDGVIKRGNSNEIRKNFEYLSDKDLARAVVRANYKKQLNSIDAKSVKTGREKFNEIMETSGKTMKVVNDTFKAARNVTDFYMDPLGLEKRGKSKR